MDEVTHSADTPIRRVSRRKLILSGFLLGAVAFGLFAAVQRVTASSNPSPIALQRAATAADALPSTVSTLLNAQGFLTASSRKIGSGLYIVPKSDGSLCIDSIGTLSDGTVSNHIGCQPSSNFFNGSQLIFGIGGGGPGSTTLHVAGVAQTGVTQVRLAIGGSTITVQPSSDGGFSVDVPVSNATFAAKSAGSASTSAGSIAAVGVGGKVLQSYTLPSS
jgi:hypothetical protein